MALLGARDRVELPFGWDRVVVYAAGATALRVRVAPGPGGNGVAVTMSDAVGRPVVTVDSPLTGHRPGPRRPPSSSYGPPTRPDRQPAPRR